MLTTLLASASTSSFAKLFIVLFIFVIVALVILIALLPAIIAKNKGYSFIGFFIFAVFLFIPALIVALCLKSQQQKQLELQAAITSAGARSQQDVTGQLNELSDLKSKGLLSETEFQAAKDKLLK